MLLFADFEDASGTAERSIQDIQKDILQQIGAIIGRSVAANSNDIQADQIDPIDMQSVVIPNICAITQFYNIPTETCTYDNDDIRPVPTTVTDQVGTSGGLA